MHADETDTLQVLGPGPPGLWRCDRYNVVIAVFNGCPPDVAPGTRRLRMRQSATHFRKKMAGAPPGSTAASKSKWPGIGT